MTKEPEHSKLSLLRFKGLFLAVGLILFGAVLMLASNMLLVDKSDVAVQNAQTQAQSIQESSLCKDSPEEEEVCIQSEKILNDPTSKNLVGPQGIQGNSGAQGSTGARGPEGPMGPAGPEGRQGPQGLFGLDGLQGSEGAPGSVGPMGPAGPAGVAGASGAYPTGIDINCSSGSVTVTLSNGSTFTGSVSCSEGPQGPAGPEGPQGPVGPAGPPGEAAPILPAPAPVPVPTAPDAAAK